MVQSHPLPLLSWLSTRASGRVEKTREGREGQMIQWIDANNVGASISDTSWYKTLTHLVRLQSQTLA